MFGKRFTRALVVATTASLILATAVLADQVDGDFADGGTAADITAGEAFSLSADLYIVRSGTAAATVTWSGPVTTGSCAGISGTANPAGFTMPDPAWHNTANGTLSTTFDASKKSTVTISGTAGVAGGTCTLTYTGSATRAASANGNPMPPGQNSVSLTVNFLAPTATNTAPTVAFTGGPTAVNESAVTQHTYSFSIDDPDADTWTFAADSPSCGTGGALVASSDTISQTTKTGSFKCVFDDGPATPIVSVQVNDGSANSNTATRGVTVSNVAPTAALTRVGPANVFTGSTVTYNASATDPSADDTTAGFWWSFNSAAFDLTAARTATAQLQQTYSTCGLQTESVRAQDKDNGISASVSATVNVFDGGYVGALKPGQKNLVQAGRVVPVQIEVNCNGPITGLSPVITLLNGDLDPTTGDASLGEAVTESVSKADTGTTMRAVVGGYIYNLAIPKDGTAGQKYTIRVQPWGAGNGSVFVLLEIRK